MLGLVLLLPLAPRALARLRTDAGVVALDVHSGLLGRLGHGGLFLQRADGRAAVTATVLFATGIVRAVGVRLGSGLFVGHHHELGMTAVVQGTASAFRVHQVVDDVVLGGPFKYGPGRYGGQFVVGAIGRWARRQRGRRRRFRYLFVNGLGVVRLQRHAAVVGRGRGRERGRRTRRRHGRVGRVLFGRRVTRLGTGLGVVRRRHRADVMFFDFGHPVRADQWRVAGGPSAAYVRRHVQPGRLHRVVVHPDEIGHPRARPVDDRHVAPVIASSAPAGRRTLGWPDAYGHLVVGGRGVRRPALANNHRRLQPRARVD